MSGPFESVARVAIEQIIKNHAKDSKFGYVLSPEGFRELTQDLYELLQTSRSLKTAGDKFLNGAQAAPGLPQKKPAVNRLSRASDK